MAKRTEVSAKTVREFFAANPDKVTDEFRTSVSTGARGRLHPKAIEAFKAANPRKAYAVGTDAQPTITLEVVKANAKGAKRKTTVKVPAKDLRAYVGATGKRGRLSKEALSKAAAHFA